MDLETRTSRPLIEGARPQFASTGDLLFERQGGVWAVAFDPARVAVVGGAVPVLESVRLAGAAQRQPLFATGPNGSLAYMSGAGANAVSSMVWVDRKGQATPALGAREVFQQPRLAPDGKRVAVSIVNAAGTDVWVYDLQTGARLKLTIGAIAGRSRRNVWSPDGTKVAFYAVLEAGGEQDLFVVPSAGGAPEVLLARPGLQYPESWSTDGRFLLFAQAPRAAGGPQRRDVWVLPIGQEPRSVLETSAGERAAVFSPDGRVIAFVSDESGRDDVYVMPFPGTGTKIPVSANGGSQPVWSRNGKELFYRERDSMMAVAIQSEPFRIVSTQKLFEFPEALYGSEPNLASYDVAADGRFLAARRDATAADEIEVVLNWTEELRRLLKR